MLTDSLFTRAKQNWDLDKIQQAVIKLKVKDHEAAELNNTEQIILCGLLCNYHPEIIARQLPIGSYENILKQTWKIYSYLQQITVAQLQINSDEYDLPTLTSLLSVTGFKKNSNALALQYENYSSNRQTEQSYNGRTLTNLKHQKIGNTGINTVNPISDRQTKVALPQQKTGSLKQSDNRAIIPSHGDFELQTDYFPSLSRWNTIGGTVTIGFMGIAAILAATIEYDVIVKAEGTVRPEGEIKLVQAFQEGKIKDIQVQENQTVKQGDIIASLDDSQLQNERQQLLDEVRQSERELIQLQERINILEVQIDIEATKGDYAPRSLRIALSIQP